MAKSREKEATDVQSLLARVREGAKGDIPSPAISGIALRRDDNLVYVATRSGIVAVPVEAILQVVNPIPARSDVVTLHVRDLESIRPVFPVRDFRLPEVLGGRTNPLEAGTTNTTTSEATETYTDLPSFSWTVS